MTQAMQYIKRYKELSLFIILQLIIFTLLFLTMFIENRQIMIWYYFIINLLNIASYYSLYRVCKTVSKHLELEVEVSFYKKQQEMQKSHLQVSKENRHRIHEIRDKIYEELDDNSLRVEDEESARSKAKELIEKYSELYMVDYSQNKTIDAILYNKLLYAKTLKIKTSAQIQVPKELPIKDIDLMFIFNNLLDNAIDACSKLPEQERFLDIDASIQANFLVVHVRNSKDMSIIVNAKSMASTKQDKEHHGLGLPIIKHVCKQNHGTMRLEDHGKFIDIYATLSASE